MKSFEDFTKIFVHKKPVDMRKQINGLCILVQEEMAGDLMAPHLFIFVNSRRTLMKTLYFDNSGFALWTKRLEEAKFPWPRGLKEEVLEVEAKDMELLLEGINIWTRFEKLNFETVV